MNIIETAGRKLQEKVLISMLEGRVANYLKPHVNDLLETLGTKTIISHDPENFFTSPGIIKLNLSTDPLSRGRHKVTLDVLEAPSSEERAYDLTQISLIRNPEGELLLKSAKPYEDRKIDSLKLLSNINKELRISELKFHLVLMSEAMQRNLISSAEVRNQLQGDSVLEKPDQLGPQATEQVIQQCNVTEDMAKKLAFTRRDNLHLLRMLRRSEAERNFSLAYLEHRDAIFAEDEEKSQAIINVICSAGEDTKMFWTFAPYLFKALTEKDVSERDAISKILSWSKDGVSEASEESNKPLDYFPKDWSRLHLKGLEKYESETYKGWVLSKDPEHISHRYTEQEARNLADLLIAEA